MVIPRIFAPLALAAVAAAGAIVPVMLDSSPATPAPQVVAQPCVDGIVPGNPYIRNCNLPQQSPRIRGQAPDAAAIIACRNIPGCLAYYVNYPGATVWDPPIARNRG